MQSLVFGLCWSRDEGLVCLIKLVCLGTTQTELEDWISSPQPLNSTEGKSGPEGLCSREGTDSLCWVCVGVLEVRLVLV